MDVEIDKPQGRDRIRPRLQSPLLFSRQGSPDFLDSFTGGGLIAWRTSCAIMDIAIPDEVSSRIHGVDLSRDAGMT